jgi:LacI family transcriptional regulator
MPRKKRSAQRKGKKPAPADGPISLRALSDYLGLAPATLSLVLNASPVARSIPKETKDRIFRAAKRFNYRPNFFARSLRAQRSYTIGVVVPEVSEGYEALVLSGIEDYLLQAGYFYLVASHRHKPDLIDECPRLLLERSVEGLIAVDTPCSSPLPVPVVAVSGEHDLKGITTIRVNHQAAARLGLEHLFNLGHRRIAFIKGQAFSSDTEDRWKAICRAARALGLEVNPQLVAQLVGDAPSPQLGYVATQKILAGRQPFTALFAFNDVSAIGAIHALRQTGRRIPEDVSVVGFDDIASAAFQSPALTTIRQPLWKMGQLAGETVLQRIANSAQKPPPQLLIVEPELIIRESTGPARMDDIRGH